MPRPAVWCCLALFVAVTVAAISKNGNLRAAPVNTPIFLRAKTLYPAEMHALGVNSRRMHSMGAGISKVTYLVQFKPELSTRECRAVATEIGVTLGDFIPEKSWKVYCLPSIAMRLANHNSVNFVVEYLPEYRVDPQLAAKNNLALAGAGPATTLASPGSAQLMEEELDGPVVYSVSSSPFDDGQTVGLFFNVDVQVLRADGKTVHELRADLESYLSQRLQSNKVHAVVSPGSLRRLVVTVPKRDESSAAAFLAESHYADMIEEEADIVLTNRRSASILQSGEGSSANYKFPIWDEGLTGDGQIIAAGDTGLDWSHCDFRDTKTSVSAGVTDKSRRKIVLIDSVNGVEGDSHGHGTHVMGSIAGNIEDGLSENRGLSYNAQVIMHNIFTSNGGLSLPGDLTTRYFNIAYDAGARIHSNSWGSPCCPGSSSYMIDGHCAWNSYRSFDQDVDQFMWQNNDMLILFAAGNDGSCGDANTVSNTAKNGITVGATSYENDIVYFTSIGLTRDGRYKPDMVAPGYNIVSARTTSSLTDLNCGTRYMSGTSMATPLTAGLAGLVREYFAKGYHPTGEPVAANAFNPSAALVKAVLMASARPVSSASTPRKEEGFGRPVLDTTLPFKGSTFAMFSSTSTGGDQELDEGESREYCVDVQTGEAIRFTLVYTDKQASTTAAKTLVNDLDLTVLEGTTTLYPNGLTGPDSTNNAEQIIVSNPAQQRYCATVTARTVVTNRKQNYALIISYTPASGVPQPEPCADRCAKCTGPGEDECTECTEGNFLTGSSCGACAAGTFENSAARTCDSCSASCATCVSVATQCTSCTSGQVLHGSSCVDTCPTGTYTLDSKCLDCDSSCQECTGPGNNRCSVCRPGMVHNGGACLDSCPDGRYPDANAVCQPCDAACFKCADTPSKCIACHNDLYLLGNSCTSNCPDGYYRGASGSVDANKCMDCPVTCATCSSSMSCTECTDGHYLHGGSCSDTCPKGYYGSPSDRTCKEGEAPGPPASFDDSKQGNNLVLTWAAPVTGTAPFSYTLWRTHNDNGAGETRVDLVSNQPNVLTHSVPYDTLPEGITVVFHLYAENGAGRGSEIVLAVDIPSSAVLPSQVTNLVVKEDTTSHDLTVTWEPPSVGTAPIVYQIIMATSADMTSGMVELASAHAATSLTVPSGQTMGSTTYYFAVHAVNGVGQGPAATQSVATAARRVECSINNYWEGPCGTFSVPEIYYSMVHRRIEACVAFDGSVDTILSVLPESRSSFHENTQMTIPGIDADYSSVGSASRTTLSDDECYYKKYWTLSSDNIEAIQAAYPSGTVPIHLVHRLATTESYRVPEEDWKTTLTDTSLSVKVTRVGDNHQWRVAIFPVVRPGAALDTMSVCLKKDVTRNKGWHPTTMKVDCQDHVWGSNAADLRATGYKLNDILFKSESPYYTEIPDVELGFGSETYNTVGTQKAYSLFYGGAFWEGLLGHHGIEETTLGKNPKFVVTILPMREATLSMAGKQSDDHGHIKSFFRGVRDAAAFDETTYDFVQYVYLSTDYNDGNFRSFAAGGKTYNYFNVFQGSSVLFNEGVNTVLHEMGHQVFSLVDLYDGFGMKFPTGVIDPHNMPNEYGSIMSKNFALKKVSDTLVQGYGGNTYTEEMHNAGIPPFRATDPANWRLTVDSVVRIAGANPMCTAQQFNDGECHDCNAMTYLTCSTVREPQPPSEPVNVLTKEAGVDIVVSWSPPTSGATPVTYTVTMADNVEITSNARVVAETSGLTATASYVQFPVSSKSLVFIRVTASNNDGSSSATVEHLTGERPVAPTKPEMFECTYSHSSDVVMCSWMKPLVGTEPLSYRLRFVRPSGDERTSLHQSMDPVYIPVVELATNEANFARGGTGTVYVTASNEWGASEEDSDSFLITDPPSVPGDLKFQEDVSTMMLKISWAIPTRGQEPISYALSMAKNADFTEAVVALDSSLASPSYEIPLSSLSGGTTYYFKVIASNKFGNSPPSIDSKYIDSRDVKPGPVRNLKTGQTGSNLLITWDEPLEGSQQMEPYNVTVDNVSYYSAVTHQRISLDSLTNGQVLTISVTARNAAGDGPPVTITHTVQKEAVCSVEDIGACGVFTARWVNHNLPGKFLSACIAFDGSSELLLGAGFTSYRLRIAPDGVSGSNVYTMNTLTSEFLNDEHCIVDWGRFHLDDASIDSIVQGTDSAQVPIRVQLDVKSADTAWKSVLDASVPTTVYPRTMNKKVFRVAVIPVVESVSTFNDMNVCFIRTAGEVGWLGASSQTNCTVNTAPFSGEHNVRSHSLRELLYSNSDATPLTDIDNGGQVPVNDQTYSVGDVNAYSLSYPTRFWQGLLRDHGVENTVALGASPQLSVEVIDPVRAESSTKTASLNLDGTMKIVMDYTHSASWKAGIDLAQYDYVVYASVMSDQDSSFGSFVLRNVSYVSFPFKHANDVPYNVGIKAMVQSLGYLLFGLSDLATGFGVQYPRGVPHVYDDSFPQLTACVMANRFAYAKPQTGDIAQSYNTHFYDKVLEEDGVPNFHTQDLENYQLCVHSLIQITGTENVNCDENQYYSGMCGEQCNPYNYYKCDASSIVPGDLSNIQTYFDKDGYFAVLGFGPSDGTLPLSLMVDLTPAEAGATEVDAWTVEEVDTHDAHFYGHRTVEDMGLTPGALYSVALYGENSAGTGAVIEVSRYVPFYPNAPRDLELGQTNEAVVATWGEPTPPTGVAGKDLEYVYDVKIGSNFYETVSSHRAEIPIENFEMNYSYYITIVPKLKQTMFPGDYVGPDMAEGPPAFSNIFIEEVVDPPSSATNLEVSEDSSGIQVTWAAPLIGSNPIEYRVSMDSFEETTTDTSMTIPTDLYSPSTTYVVHVVAFNKGGEAPSVQAEHTSDPRGSAPGAVQYLAAEETEFGLRVSYEPPTTGDPVLTYSISIHETKGALDILMGTVETQNLSKEFERDLFDVGVAYTVTVIAKNTAGSGPATTTQTGFMDPPGPVASMSVYQNRWSVVVEWEEPLDGSSPMAYTLVMATNEDMTEGRYVLRYKSKRKPYRQSVSVRGFAKAGQLNEETTYYFQLFAENVYGKGPAEIVPFEVEPRKCRSRRKPKRCPQGCVRAWEECDEPEECPAGTHLCSNGKCRTKCKPINGCPLGMVMCPNGFCKSDESKCPSFKKCANGKVLCWDNRCRAPTNSKCNAPWVQSITSHNVVIDIQSGSERSGFLSAVSSTPLSQSTTSYVSSISEDDDTTSTVGIVSVSEGTFSEKLQIHVGAARDETIRNSITISYNNLDEETTPKILTPVINLSLESETGEALTTMPTMAKPLTIQLAADSLPEGVSVSDLCLAFFHDVDMVFDGVTIPAYALSCTPYEVTQQSGYLKGKTTHFSSYAFVDKNSMKTYETHSNSDSGSSDPTPIDLFVMVGLPTIVLVFISALILLAFCVMVCIVLRTGKKQSSSLASQDASLSSIRDNGLSESLNPVFTSSLPPVGPHVRRPSTVEPAVLWKSNRMKSVDMGDGRSTSVAGSEDANSLEMSDLGSSAGSSASSHLMSSAESRQEAELRKWKAIQAGASDGNTPAPQPAVTDSAPRRKKSKRVSISV